MKEMVGGCCVCSDERGWAENPLVYCDGSGCNVAVHQACYGIVTVPTGPWFCRKCESHERAARVVSLQRCELCPSKDGALKRTDNGGWAHVVCALYIPEVRFGNVTTMEPIILQLVPQDRFNKNCYLCEEQGKESKATIGACMQCNKSGCRQHFHVTCAQAAGLLCEEAGNYMDNVKYCGYCQYHYQKLGLRSSCGSGEKKGTSIKPIPAFKPIPADDATPDSTPEKTSPPRDLKDRSSKTRPEKKANKSGTASTSSSSSLVTETVSNVSFSDSSNSSSSNKPESNSNNGSTGGKFTTANFTETVITHSGSVFGSAEKASGKKSKKMNSANGAMRTPSAAAVHHMECPVTNGTEEDDACMSAADAVSNMTKNFSLLDSNAESNTSIPSALGATPSGTFTSAYENFLSGSYPGITSSENDQAVMKRQRSQSTERAEKKRHKKGNGVSSKKNKKKRETVSIPNGLGSYSAQCTPPTLPNGVSVHHMIQPSQLNNVLAAGTSSPAECTLAAESTNSHTETSNASPSTRTSSSPMVGPARQGLGGGVINRNPSSNNTVPQFPQSLEQLLERQWDQGSQFLMEQAQHFDIASLLSCLHQLRMENQRLEEHVNSLISRRDHLLAVNARLSVSLNTPNLLANPAAPNAMMAEGARTPRINNYIPMENGVHSPQATSPAQASTPSVSGLVTSATPPHGQPMVSLMSNLTAGQSPNLLPGLSGQTTGLMHSLPGTPTGMLQAMQSPSLMANPGHNQSPTSLLASRRSPAQPYIPSASPVGSRGNYHERSEMGLCQPPVATTPVSRAAEQMRMQQSQLINRTNLGQCHLMRSPTGTFRTFQPPPPPLPSTVGSSCHPMPVIARPNWAQSHPFPMYAMASSSFPSSSSMHNPTMSTPVSVVMSLASQSHHQQPNQQQSQQQVIQQHSSKKSSPSAMGNLPDNR